MHFEQLEARSLFSASVVDINPGPNGSDPVELVKLGGGTIFIADDGASNGADLWKTDGTAVGTVKLHEFNSDSIYHKLTAVGGKAFFVVDTSTSTEVWITDGTAGGTVKLTEQTGPVRLNAAVAYGNQFLFTVGTALYKTGGTAASTIAITGGDMSVETLSAPVVWKNSIYFFAQRGTERGLFKSNGTAASTSLAAPYTTEGTMPRNLIATPERLYFSYAGWDIGYSDGKTLSKLSSGVSDYAVMYHPSGLKKIGDQLYFNAINRQNGGWVGEIWKVNGTLGVKVGLPADLPEFARPVVTVNKVLYTVVGDQLRIFRGAILASDLASADELIDAGDRVVFRIKGEIWESMGTLATTKKVANIDGWQISSVVKLLGAVGTKVFLSMKTDDVGTELRIVDVPHTLPPAPPAPPASSVRITYLQNNLYVLGSAQSESFLVQRRATDPTKFEIIVNGTYKGSYKFVDVNYLFIVGDAGDDRIELSQGNGPLALKTRLNGDRGNDTIYGGAGSDQIRGGAGNDWISAGAGNDAVYGEAGNDKLFGGAGDDLLDGGEGSDVLRGDDGRDRIVGTVGFDDYTKNRGDILNLSH